MPLLHTETLIFALFVSGGITARVEKIIVGEYNKIRQIRSFIEANASTRIPDYMFLPMVQANMLQMSARMFNALVASVCRNNSSATTSVSDSTIGAVRIFNIYFMVLFSM